MRISQNIQEKITTDWFQEVEVVIPLNKVGKTMTFTWGSGPGLLFPGGICHPIPISIVCGWYGGQKS